MGQEAFQAVQYIFQNSPVSKKPPYRELQRTLAIHPRADVRWVLPQKPASGPPAMTYTTLLILPLMALTLGCASQTPLSTERHAIRKSQKISEAPHVIREITDESMVRIVSVERTGIDGMIVHTKTQDTTTYTDASRVQTTMLVDYDCDHRFFRDTSVTIIHTFKKSGTQKPISYPLDNQWLSIDGPDASADKKLALKLVCGQD